MLLNGIFVLTIIFSSFSSFFLVSNPMGLYHKLFTTVINSVVYLTNGFVIGSKNVKYNNKQASLQHMELIEATE